MAGSLDPDRAKSAAFLRLAKSLRKLGAVRVKNGSYEVAWSDAPADTKPAEKPTAASRPLAVGERSELDTSRAKLAKFRELGMDV